MGSSQQQNISCELSC